MNDDLRQALAQAGSTYTRHRVLRIALGLLPALIGLGLAAIVVDILLHLPAGTRAIIRNAFAGLALVLALSGIAIALLRRPPILRTARLLEETLPELDSRLINLLQLEKQATDPSTPELTRSLARRAMDDAARDLPIRQLPIALRTPRLPLLFLRAAYLPAAIALLTGLAGEPARREWARFLDPHGDHPPLSFTQLAIAVPDRDGFTVDYRDGFDLLAIASGHRPKELFATALDPSGEILFTLPLVSQDGRQFTAHIEDVRQPLALYVHTADQASLSTQRHIEVRLEPRIDSAELTLTPPEYTGQPSQSMPFRFQGLRALQGTELRFRLRSNRPLGRGRVLYEIPGREALEIPLTPVPDAPETVEGDLTATSSGRLVFSVEDPEGRPGQETASTSITVTQDAAPAVNLRFPTENTFVVETMTLVLAADAADDLGLRSMRLHHAVDGHFTEPELARFDPPGELRHSLMRTLDLPALGLRAGRVLTVFADALDGAPDPHLTRTETRTLTLITEDEYNEYLRREADVGLIAGKYEEVLDRLRAAIEEQQEIEKAFASTADLPADEVGASLAAAYERQRSLNQKLEALAEDFRHVARENPVYDFEQELGERLAERADAIEASVADNRRDLEDILGSSATGSPQPDREADLLEKAAHQQWERLGGEQQTAEEQVREPLEDLAAFHELLKNFNQLRDLADQQRQLSDQTAAVDHGQPLTPEDKAALRDLAHAQRQLGQRLDQLEKKLRQDADQLGEDLGDIADAARNLADQMGARGLPGQARDAAGEMLEGDASKAHRQAGHLAQELENLLKGPGDSGQQDGERTLASLLQALGLQPGQNFQQMLQSLRFSPPNMGQASGSSGIGLGGMQSQSMIPGIPSMMLGGESFRSGDIARRMAGIGGGGGLGTGHEAQVEGSAPAPETLRSSRRTDTPQTASLLQQYEAIADAYFQRLTTPESP
ncbi:methyl-accepting chemotaxis protein [Haloferula luteola]|uniref:Methyl-accepting chemotaxis protein n=1 Tax=Haloferula luteola TaxID=595692 RepID=A0A840V372_9BACT|nr:hypothetical protein [Haloferula luteola]MBB5351486.1 methyl-accepting chemotaxis protein [Haloferula luteola]